MTPRVPAGAPPFVSPPEATEPQPPTGQHPAPMALAPLQARASRPVLQVRSTPEQLPLFPAPIAYRKAG